MPRCVASLSPSLSLSLFLSLCLFFSLSHTLSLSLPLTSTCLHHHISTPHVAQESKRASFPAISHVYNTPRTVSKHLWSIYFTCWRQTPSKKESEHLAIDLQGRHRTGPQLSSADKPGSTAQCKAFLRTSFDKGGAAGFTAQQDCFRRLRATTARAKHQRFQTFPQRVPGPTPSVTAY